MPNPPYKKDEYIHFLRENTGEEITVKAKKDSKRAMPVQNKIFIPFEQIEEMNLDNRGEVVPFSMKNVINISRYFKKFWIPILGTDAGWLYIFLSEYCDDTDICYPKVEELMKHMNLSSYLVKKALDKLVEHNFVFIIYRLNKLADNKETSPIYKLRQTIPLLSKELVSTLPESLKKKHDEFMVKYGKGTNQDLFEFNHSETWRDMVNNGEKMVSSKTRKKIQEIIENEEAVKYLATKLAEEETVEEYQTISFHSELQNTFSKPAYDTFYLESMAVLSVNEKYTEGHIIVKTDTIKDYIKVTKSHMEKLHAVCEKLFDRKIHDITIFTVKEYIIKIERVR